MLKICKGTSVQKVLAREVNKCTASKFILGVAKHTRSIRLSSLSIAKYCAKTLPFDCSVVAFSNGKIVFQRGQVGKDVDDSNSFPLSEDGSNHGYSAAEENVTMVGASLKQNCSICESVSEPPSLNESKEDEPVAPVPMENSDAPVSCLGTPVVKEIPRARPSRRLLRRPVFSSITSSSSSSEWPRISVARWALRLPSRHSAVHPHHRLMKSSANAISNIDTESTPSSVAVHDDEGVLSKELGVSSREVFIHLQIVQLRGTCEHYLQLLTREIS